MADRNDDEPTARSTPTEQELLLSHLRGARDALIWKVEGLDAQDRRRPMTPTGTNLVGLVKHMTWIEGWCLCEFFRARTARLSWEWEYSLRFSWTQLAMRATATSCGS